MTAPTPRRLDAPTERLLRDLAPQVLGALVRRWRDFADAEDAVQEALIAAAAQWPRDGVPENPRGWLIRVAQRRLTDHLRSEIARRNREAALAAETSTSVEPTMTSEIEREDTLVLLFLCCHAALTRPSAIALTLRAVGGLTTAEIASAFLVPEATIGQRISRAKQTIATSRLPFRLPDASERRERLGSVLHVLYLIFNEGYTASSGPDLLRADLSAEAIRLTRELGALLPSNGEVEALLALMLLTDARRLARAGPDGQMIPLEEQDRTLWDQEAIAEGVALADAALSRGSIGEYHLQAAIAAVHDQARRAEETDWRQILALYDLLERISDNPLVALNRAVATAMVDGPDAGLRLLEPLRNDGRLRGTHRLDAVRAHLLERAGERDAAVDLFRLAAEKTTSLPERNYLLKKAARLTGAMK